MANRAICNRCSVKLRFVRHGETVHPGGLGVDGELELGRLHDWQLSGFRTLENATREDADLTDRIQQARPVAHQPTGFDK
jgi:hypothetical protein